MNKRLSPPFNLHVARKTTLRYNVPVVNIAWLEPYHSASSEGVEVGARPVGTKDLKGLAHPP